MTTFIVSLNDIRNRVKEEALLLSNFIVDVKALKEKQLESAIDTSNSFRQTERDIKAGVYPLPTTKKEKEDYDFWQKYGETVADALKMKANLIEKYEELLHNMALIYSTALFDAQFLDLVKILLLSNENSLKSSKTITIETVLQHSSLDTLKSYILNKELVEFGFKSLSDQIKYVSEKFNLNFKNEKIEIDEIIEIIETRNIHVHNRGIINSIYLTNTKSTIYYLGDYRTIDNDYLEKSRKSLNKFINHLLDLTIEKLKYCPS